MNAGFEGLASMKSQFKRADASGARYALIFGDDELERGEVALKEPARRRRTATQPRRWRDAAAWADDLRTA